MSPVSGIDPPAGSLLLGLREGGAFADCYAVDVPGTVTQAQFIEAFYTTGLFKAERFVLRWLAGRPSSDLDARQLAHGEQHHFAAWRVAQRRADQILLTDVTGSTSSWLKSEAIALPSGGNATRLYFGSAVNGRNNQQTGRREFGRLFHALLGFHALYSRRLLLAARSRLLARRGAGV